MSLNFSLAQCAFDVKPGLTGNDHTKFVGWTEIDSNNKECYFIPTAVRRHYAYSFVTQKSLRMQ